jgi:hypothetical protein
MLAKQTPNESHNEPRASCSLLDSRWRADGRPLSALLGEAAFYAPRLSGQQCCRVDHIYCVALNDRYHDHLDFDQASVRGADR